MECVTSPRLEGVIVSCFAVTCTENNVQYLYLYVRVFVCARVCVCMHALEPSKYLSQNVSQCLSH